MAGVVPPPDAPARDRIETDLGTNLLVEAGAGSGKTESLARRMAAGIASGKYAIDELAAVTFTRKAAAELRGRVQQALESRRERATDAGEIARVEAALAGIERMFSGTIHAFCARLLRERPVEAGIAPDFVELDESEDVRDRRRALREFLQRLRAEHDPQLTELQAAGVQPDDLDEAFFRVCEHEDVEFPCGPAVRPDMEAVWPQVDRFWARLQGLLPEGLSGDAKCGAQQTALSWRSRHPWFAKHRRHDLPYLLADWEHDPAWKNYAWGDGSSRGNAVAADAKRLVADFRSAVVEPLMRAWRVYVYGLAIPVLVRARADYAARRRRANAVNYVDLLMITARMLRASPGVRRALQRKFRWLFIDEFQDTDPIQAEIFLWLASDESGGTRQPAPGDPWSVALRPGALFVVGDPKQSIYRFRRADIQIYNRVRDLIGEANVVSLTANFRSVPQVCEFANTVFATRFPEHRDTWSPRFERTAPARSVPVMPAPAPRSSHAGKGRVPAGDRGADAAIVRLPVPGHLEKPDTSAWEAEAIARHIRCEVDAGRRTFGDFLVLTRNKRRLGEYAAALDALDIPVEVSGAGRFGDAPEVGQLALVLKALADPADGAALVGVLRGSWFGVSDRELFAFVHGGGRLDLGVPVPDPMTPAGDARTLGDVCPNLLAALAALGEWWRWTRAWPLPIAVARIVHASGQLAFGACSEGGAPAGRLVQAVDRVREVVERGGTLADAADALEAEIDDTEVEALPLEPGRREVVRVMNLHKAKGLEAGVVFLADPANYAHFAPSLRIERRGDGAAGFVQIQAEWGENGRRVVAEPEGWTNHQAEEQRYRDAEDDRLLYVAATRARDVLVVGQWARPPRKGGGSYNAAWGVLDGFLADTPELVVSDAVAVPARPGTDLSDGARQAAKDARGSAHERVSRPSWAAALVTTETKRLAMEHGHPVSGSRVASALGGPGSTGPSLVVLSAASTDAALETILPDTPSHRAERDAGWGVLIHGLLEHAMRVGDRELSTEELRRLASWLAVEKPDLQPHLDEAVAIALAVTKAPFWRDALDTSRHYVEVPFAFRLDPGEAGPGGEPVTVPTVLHGVIDLVHESGRGWQVRDYKTGALPVEEMERRYGPQLAIYRDAWTRIVG